MSKKVVQSNFALQHFLKTMKKVPKRGVGNWRTGVLVFVTMLFESFH
jgi:hypothetical protein